MAVTTFKDLPLAPRDRKWDAAEAEKRVRTWAQAEDRPNQKFRKAHVRYDAENKDEFGAYKLPIADVIDGRLQVVPRAVTSAGGVIDRARGGIDLPSRDIPRVKAHLKKYYEKMGEEPPWDGE